MQFSEQMPKRVWKILQVTTLSVMIRKAHYKRRDGCKNEKRAERIREDKLFYFRNGHAFSPESSVCRIITPEDTE